MSRISGSRISGKISIRYIPKKYFRKFYYLDKEQSIGDPDTTYITVPNIPLLTALASTKDMGGLGKSIKVDLILREGLGTPFINVSFSGLLWG